MLYELRVYNIIPGQTERQIELFQESVMPLFEKHSIKVTSFWETVSKEVPQLIYVCEFEDEDHLRGAWKSFREDPQWVSAKKVYDDKGLTVSSITSTLMKQTDFANR